MQQPSSALAECKHQWSVFVKLEAVKGTVWKCLKCGEYEKSTPVASSGATPSPTTGDMAKTSPRPSTGAPTRYRVGELVRPRVGTKLHKSLTPLNDPYKDGNILVVEGVCQSSYKVRTLDGLEVNLFVFESEVELVS